MPLRSPSLSSAGSQYTPCTGPAASQLLSSLASVSASGASLTRRTSTPKVCSRCASASPTPDLSGITTTLRPDASAAPVGLQRATDGRKLGTGTRRGIRLTASKLAGVGRPAIIGFEPDGAGTAGCFCTGAGFSCTAEELAARPLNTP